MDNEAWGRSRKTTISASLVLLARFLVKATFAVQRLTSRPSRESSSIYTLTDLPHANCTIMRPSRLRERAFWRSVHRYNSFEFQTSILSGSWMYVYFGRNKVAWYANITVSHIMQDHYVIVLYHVERLYKIAFLLIFIKFNIYLISINFIK